MRALAASGEFFFRRLKDITLCMCGVCKATRERDLAASQAMRAADAKTKSRAASRKVSRCLQTRMEV